jgi:subtilisin-like proprotein convertase family protein
MRKKTPLACWLFRSALAIGCHVLISGWSGPVRADMAGLGVGGLIPNNDAAGISSTIVFAVDEAVETLDVSIDFGPLVPGATGHSFVGDLSATLTAPDGRQISLFHRPGVPATASGDSSNVSGSYRWIDGGASFTSAAAAVGNGTSVANGDYSAQAADDTFLSFDAIFGGAMTAGNWKLHVADQKTRDAGGFASWSIRITSAPIIVVPETSSTLVLVVASILAARWHGKHGQEKRRRVQRAWY